MYIEIRIRIGVLIKLLPSLASIGWADILIFIENKGNFGFHSPYFRWQTTKYHDKPTTFNLYVFISLQSCTNIRAQISIADSDPLHFFRHIQEKNSRNLKMLHARHGTYIRW